MSKTRHSCIFLATVVLIAFYIVGRLIEDGERDE